MKSKVLCPPSDKSKNTKTFEFLQYYKTVAESNTDLKRDSTLTNANDSTGDTTKNSSKRRRSPNKSEKKKFKGDVMSVTKIDIDGHNLIRGAGKRSPLNGSKVTSTPNDIKTKSPRIKSIMKGTHDLENSLDVSNVPQINRKKRNKSVSFMIEDNDEVVIKKSKSNDSLETKAVKKNKIKTKNSKIKSQKKEDKENNGMKIDIDSSENVSQKSDVEKNKRKNFIKKIKKSKSPTSVQVVDKDLTVDNLNVGSGDTPVTNVGSVKLKKAKSAVDVPIHEKSDIKKKKRKNVKKNINLNSEAEMDDKDKTEIVQITKKKEKKTKKNKHKAELSEISEPAKKTIKKNKPDSIAEGIENLNIGDNAHTLTDLLGGMAVTKNKKNKKMTKDENVNTEVTPAEKVKSKKNRKRKNRNLNAIVLVQNLPFKILLCYKQKLKELFSKYGTVHSVGVADLKCSKDDIKPIFTTRVFFKTEEEATAALAEDKELVAGNMIRVKKFLAAAVRTAKCTSWTYRTTSHISEKNVEENQEEKRDNGSD